MKWDNDKGHTDALIPMLKSIHNNGTIKKQFVVKAPELFTETEVTDKGKEFHERCLKLFPFLKEELNG